MTWPATSIPLPGLVVHGHVTGVVSSRNLERAIHDSVAFRFAAANRRLDHDTIATFRRRFLPQAADRAEVPDGMQVPQELAGREKRLAAIARADAVIEPRAKEPAL